MAQEGWMDLAGHESEAYALGVAAVSSQQP